MEKKVIQEIILWQQDFIKNIKLQKRNITIDPAGNYVLVGMRRAGKTYTLYQYIQHLLREGHNAHEILFVNFEDERITDIKKEDLHIIIDAYHELFANEPIICKHPTPTGTLLNLQYFMEVSVCRKEGCDVCF